MPQPFQITAAADTVRLDAQGRGSATFTVSNISGRPRRGRARLSPSGPGQSAWLSLDGEAEREFTADGTHQYTVRVAVPPGTPAGRHTFGLDMVSVENPDEEWSQGPKMAFEAAAPAPAKRPFPWWIVAALAAVLVVGGVIAWLMSRQEPDEESIVRGLGEVCNPGEECVLGLVCTEVPEGGKRCLGSEGYTGCKTPGDCVAGLVCRSGACARPAGVLEPCASSEECGADLACDMDAATRRGICVGKVGFSPCESDRACADGLTCQGNACRGPLRFSPCAGDAQCVEGLSCIGQACLGAPGFTGCSSAEDCAQGLQCHGGSCRGPLRFATCDADSDCMPGLVCANGSCLAPPGAPCAANEDCSSGRCVERTQTVGGGGGVFGVPEVSIPLGMFCQ